MAYRINLRVYQANTETFFQIVEKTVWNYANGGTWAEANGEQVLTMGGSGTSGTLRFVSTTGSSFLLALGVHNYKRWVDIQPDPTKDQTATVMHPSYYNAGTAQAEAREAQRSTWTVQTAQGQQVTVTCTQEEGQHNLHAVLIIT